MIGERRMKLVIGGACQGKRSYASRQYQIKDPDWTDGNTCCPEELFGAEAVFDFHMVIRRLLKEEKDVQKWVGELWENNPRLVIVTNEVGYGIVPMEAEERVWREACGRACTILASRADEVVRVCCGIGGKIKG